MLNPTRRAFASCLSRVHLAIQSQHGTSMGMLEPCLVLLPRTQPVTQPPCASNAFNPQPGGSFRTFAASAGDDYSDEVEEIHKLFAEGRDEIEYAREDSETTYFNESVEGAKVIVDACIGKWDTLLARLPDAERGKLQRSMGLKMEQLKAEFDELRKMHS